MRKVSKYYWSLSCLLMFFIIFSELHFLNTFSQNNPKTKDAFTFYSNIFENISKDLQVFPVKPEEAKDLYPVTFTDTFGAQRSYGGKRIHEGCDLMAKINERGKYEVCSMTNGVVTNIGWLEQGGWRIGITSESGIYYYYAHLDSYEKEFQKGEQVAAGQILGRMGDSGYGKEPGTKGNFDVHLHIGIYAKDSTGNERAVNPYGFLKMLEQ